MITRSVRSALGARAGRLGGALALPLLVLSLVSGALGYAPRAALAAPACQVNYTLNQWSTGFTAEVKITNNGAAINGWTLAWTFAGNQQITNMWNATYTQTGASVTARNVAWNGGLPTGGSQAFGFQASYSGSNAVPANFTLNGVPCNDEVVPTATATATRTTTVPTATATATRTSTVPTATATATRTSTVPTATATATRTSTVPTATPTATRTSTVPTATPTATIPGGDTNDDWLHTDGSRIVDSAGNPVWLTGANWFGYNATERVFHGLWAVNLEQIVKAIAERGINIVRVPISTQLILEWRDGVFKTPNVNTYVNPELEGLTSLQIFDRYLALSKKYGMKVMIDVHSAEADNSGHFYPVWYKGTITPEQFYQAWEWITNRYKNDDTIVAMDIKNEPHGTISSSEGFAKWDNSTDINNWKYACETASRRILAINPNVLVLCEGNEVYPKPGFDYTSKDPKSYYGMWWGGNLRGVRDYPVNLGANQDQLVYSPHDYGPSVFQQTWFYPGFTKETLYNDAWRDNWFYIQEQDIAPLLIGEWGGHMDGGDNQRWMTALRDFIIEKRIHQTFWCINPNSGDTGGLLGYDWTTWDSAKYNLLKPALWADRGGKFVGLDHKVPLGNSTVGTNVTEYYRNGNPAPVSN